MIIIIATSITGLTSLISLATIVNKCSRIIEDAISFSSLLLQNGASRS